MSTTSANCRPQPPPPKFTVCVGKSGVSVIGGEMVSPALNSPECRVQFACSPVAASACCAAVSVSTNAHASTRPTGHLRRRRTLDASAAAPALRPSSWARSSLEMSAHRPTASPPTVIDALWRRPATSVVSLHGLPGLCIPSGTVHTTGRDNRPAMIEATPRSYRPPRTSSFFPTTPAIVFSGVGARAVGSRAGHGLAACPALCL